MARLTRANFLKLSALALGWPAAGSMSGCAPASNAGGGLRIRARSHRGQRPGAHDGALGAAGRGLCREARPVRGRGLQRRRPQPGFGAHAGDRCGGQTVTPGFIDAHCHVSGIDELFGVDTNLRTVKAVQDAMRARAEKTPPGQWVDGFMFDDTKLEDGPLHRRHLDEAVPESSGRRRPSRRAYRLVQQRGASRWRASPRPRRIPPMAGSFAMPRATTTGVWPSWRAKSSTASGCGRPSRRNRTATAAAGHAPHVGAAHGHRPDHRPRRQRQCGAAHRLRRRLQPGRTAPSGVPDDAAATTICGMRVSTAGSATSGCASAA